MTGKEGEPRRLKVQLTKDRHKRVFASFGVNWWRCNEEKNSLIKTQGTKETWEDVVKWWNETKLVTAYPGWSREALLRGRQSNAFAALSIHPVQTRQPAAVMALRSVA